MIIGRILARRVQRPVFSTDLVCWRARFIAGGGVPAVYGLPNATEQALQLEVKWHCERRGERVIVALPGQMIPKRPINGATAFCAGVITPGKVADLNN